jgi:hypothetical protein
MFILKTKHTFYLVGYWALHLKMYIGIYKCKKYSKYLRIFSHQHSKHFDILNIIFFVNAQCLVLSHIIFVRSYKAILISYYRLLLNFLYHSKWCIRVIRALAPPLQMSFSCQQRACLSFFQPRDKVTNTGVFYTLFWSNHLLLLCIDVRDDSLCELTVTGRSSIHING